MARSDPPGGAPGLAVIIHSGKPDVKGGRMSPPGGGQGGAAGKTKASPVEATVIRANEHCQNCKNYNFQDGSCEQVDGSFQPDDACVKYFSPMSDEEPDADDRAPGQSGQDYDADDSDEAGG